MVGNIFCECLKRHEKTDCNQKSRQLTANHRFPEYSRTSNGGLNRPVGHSSTLSGADFLAGTLWTRQVAIEEMSAHHAQ